MEFKLDENLPVEAAEVLRRVGYDAVTVLEQNLGGAADPEVASVCQKEGRTLITLDTDFADIRTYTPSRFSGLIILRLQRQDKPHVLEVIERLIPMFGREPIDRLLWIVEETRIRIRG